MKLKRVGVILIIMLITVIMNSNVLGTDFDYQNYQPAPQQGYGEVVDWAGSFLGILRNVGVIVGVVGIAIIGIKYMLGSVEQKAQYKQTLIPFAIGILMLVAGTVLVSVIYEVFA